MASLRYHTHIDRSPDEVWAVVTDVGGIDTWMPGLDGCTLDGDVRTVATMGIEIQEQVFVNDAELRRVQYGIVGGAMVPEHHLATIDVIEDGDGALLVYSCDVRPDELAGVVGPVYQQSTDALKAHLEG